MDYATLLGGDFIDQRELVAKFGPSQSDVHVNSPAQRKKERRLAQVGMAGTALAGTAGLHATYLTVKEHGGSFNPKNFRTPKGPVQDALPGMEKLGKVPAGRKAALGAAAVGAGWLGLHGAELGADALAARALHRQYKANQDPHKKKKEVAKAYEQVVEARRQGFITTEQALEIIEKGKAGNVARGWAGMSRNKPWDIGLGWAATKATGRAAKEQTNRLADFTYRSLPSVKRQRRSMLRAYQQEEKAAGPRYLVRAAVLTGATGGAAVGYHQGKKVNKAADDQVDYGFYGEISKVNEDKRLVFGWCSLSEIDGEPVVDLQNDWAPIDEIEKSAYAYVMGSRIGGDMHQRDGDAPKHTSDLVESFIATPDKLQQMGLSEEAAKSIPTGWWCGFKIKDDDVWAKVKSGERLAFSIHGKGSRITKELD